MTKPEILAVHSVRDYFEHAVRTAIALHPFKPDHATTSYLVELLVEYARQAPALSELSAAVVEDREVPRRPARRVKQLKRAGDQALYIAGYFRPSLRNRRRLDLDYYKTMGRTAYRRLSRLLRVQGGMTRLIEVYSQLDRDFPECAEVLAEVGAQSGPNPDVARIYERWLSSGSRELEAKLRAAGVVLQPDRADNN